MTYHKDGIWKNIEVVKDEWDDVGLEWRMNTARLREAPWLRKPHVVVNYLTEMNRSLPRTYTYIQLVTLVSFIVWGVAYAV